MLDFLKQYADSDYIFTPELAEEGFAEFTVDKRKEEFRAAFISQYILRNSSITHLIQPEIAGLVTDLEGISKK